MFYTSSIFPPPVQSTTRYLYDAARMRSWLQRLSAFFSRSRRLLALNDIGAAYMFTNRYDLGTRTIPIRQIHGSENRTDDFDVNFRPLSDRSMHRWLSIAEAQLQGVSLPPIELVQVKDMYFVRDGHHRISVARALGQTDIDAVITVWEVGQ